MSVDKMIEESMRNISRGLTERNLLTLFKQFDGRDKIDDLKKLLSKLETMIEKGQGNVCIRAMVRSKKKGLNRRLFGSPPSTPPESEDEDYNELPDYSVDYTYSGNILDTSSVEHESSPSEKSVVIQENLNKATQDNQTKTLVSTDGNNF